MGRGKHRVQTTSPLTAVKVAATITGSATLAAVVPAEAAAEPVTVAPSVDWGPIVKCESGGDPKATNKKSTASGALQFINGSWAAYGGKKYGKRAKDATLAQQIEIANVAYARDGLAPWNASKHCWGKYTKQIKTGTTTLPGAKAATPTPAKPKATPTPNPAPAQQLPDGVKLGQRDRDGRGYYTCDAAHLRFDACDPGTLGQVLSYPVYDGHNAQPLPPLSGNQVGVKLEAYSTPAPAPAKPAAAPAPASLGLGIVATARTYYGVRYVWGGNSRAGLDCSGLVQQVMKARGIRVPRTADQQMRASRRIPKSAARPGDLAFRVSKGRAFHVGIVSRPGYYIEAPQKGQRVSEHRIPTSGVVYGRVA